MTARIFLKLILGVLCVLVVALTAVDFQASKVAQRTYVDTLTRDLADKCRMLALLAPDGFATIDADTFRNLARAAGGRATAVGRDGRVRADSETAAAQMENHASRPEIAAALAGSVGSAVRLSNSIGIKYLYVAIPVPSGALRIAVPLNEIDGQVNAIRKQLLASVAIAFLPAIVVAALFARYVSSKLAGIIGHAGNLARGDFRIRLKVTNRDEFGILGDQLNETGQKLQKMFEELEREHEQLEKLERVRKDFVINVSHELRTPLASIQGYTETLLDGAIHDEANNIKFLTIIRQNSERLGRLIGDLMTLSRIELKTTKFQFASYFVNAMIEDCIESMRPMAEKKHIKLIMDSAPERTEVFCDSEAVHQVVTNLLDNALKYTPENGSITVGARALLENDAVEIYVHDTGMGIPAEDLPRLFERFYRVDKARSRELGGTGLGLAIVKHLVRAQGGEVRVESKFNDGSRFSFTLPVHDLGLLEYGAVQPELTVL